MPVIRSTEKPSKTETLAIRLDPKTKYGLELISRKQRRSLTSVVEWLINDSIRNELVTEVRHEASLFQGGMSYSRYFLDDIWDLDEVIRLIKLIDFDKSYLNFEEELIWKTVRENAYYWIGEETQETYSWDTADISALLLDRVRQDFSILKEIGSGRKGTEDLENYFPAGSLGRETPSKRVYYFNKEVEFLRGMLPSPKEIEELKIPSRQKRKAAKTKGDK